MGDRYFPMFVDLSGKKITVVGGGKVALRRVRTLLLFGPDITVISPELEEELRTLQREGQLKWVKRAYREGDIGGADLVLAATDRPEVNAEIADACRKSRIPVNTADRKELCDFYFPAVLTQEEMVIAVGSGGKNPEKVGRMRRELEFWLKKSE